MIALLIVASLLVVLVLLGILFMVLWKRRKAGIQEEPDYRAFVALGFSFISLGVVLSVVVNPGFFGFLALGVIYFVIGLKNRDKWKKKESN